MHALRVQIPEPPGLGHAPGEVALRFFAGSFVCRVRVGSSAQRFVGKRLGSELGGLSVAAAAGSTGGSVGQVRSTLEIPAWASSSNSTSYVDGKFIRFLFSFSDRLLLHLIIVENVVFALWSTSLCSCTYRSFSISRLSVLFQELFSTYIEKIFPNIRLRLRLERSSLDRLTKHSSR